MSDKQSKIHLLGPRKMSATGRSFFNSTGHSGFGVNVNINKPILPIMTMTQPLPQIRYMLVQHPQFDALVKQLSGLRAKYDQLLIKFQQKPSQQSIKANIREVIESTHDIECKMSRIVEDANKMSETSQQHKQSNLMQTSSKQAFTKKSQHEQQCLQIIQTVNRATQKIQELQLKNNKLCKQIETQKQWKQSLDNENKRLRLMLQNMESQKHEEIQKMMKQLNELKKQQQNKQNEFIKKSQWNKNKGVSFQNAPLQKSFKNIQNSPYLQQSRLTNIGGNQQISGFSRITINGEQSRLSRVYQ